MLKDKDLTPERSDVFIKCEKGEKITLLELRGRVKEAAEEFGIPVSFGEDQIQSGGLFSKTVQDCMTMFHPEHPNDYFRNAFTVRNQGNMYYVSVYYYGTSKQIKSAAVAANAKDSLTHGLLGGGGALAVGGAIVGGLRSLGGNKQKLQEEQDYYHALARVFDEALGGESLTV